MQIVHIWICFICMHGCLFSPVGYKKPTQATQQITTAMIFHSSHCSFYRSSSKYVTILMQLPYNLGQFMYFLYFLLSRYLAINIYMLPLLLLQLPASVFSLKFSFIFSVAQLYSNIYKHVI